MREWRTAAAIRADTRGATALAGPGGTGPARAGGRRRGGPAARRGALLVRGSARSSARSRRWRRSVGWAAPCSPPPGSRPRRPPWAGGRGLRGERGRGGDDDGGAWRRAGAGRAARSSRSRLARWSSGRCAPLAPTTAASGSSAWSPGRGARDGPRRAAGGRGDPHGAVDRRRRGALPGHDEPCARRRRYPGAGGPRAQDRHGGSGSRGPAARRARLRPGGPRQAPAGARRRRPTQRRPASELPRGGRGNVVVEN